MKKWKLSQRIYLACAALFLAVTIGATIYSQTGYVAGLPQVVLGKADQGKVPKICIQDNEEGNQVLNTVEQQDGPWGKRYVIRQLEITNTYPVDDTTVMVFECMNLKNPLVLTSSTPQLWEGQEVRLGGGAQELRSNS